MAIAEGSAKVAMAEATAPTAGWWLVQGPLRTLILTNIDPHLFQYYTWYFLVSLKRLLHLKYCFNYFAPLVARLLQHIMIASIAASSNGGKESHVNELIDGYPMTHPWDEFGIFTYMNGLDFSGKCRYIYQSHGSNGYDLGFFLGGWWDVVGIMVYPKSCFSSSWTDKLKRIQHQCNSLV